ncbi:MAG: hypothetical protein D6751_07845 [Deltaproteobacteria bacterium]|nr:MAG: hypothetical protein D6751_07845 [Deltaproteobacteria bacterium]
MRIVLPYYGYLITPKQGLTDLFYLVDLDLVRGEVVRVDLVTRAARGKKILGNWCRKSLVAGVLSKDAPMVWLQELREAGVWHRAVRGEDLQEMLNDWWCSAQGEALAGRGLDEALAAREERCR